MLNKLKRGFWRTPQDCPGFVSELKTHLGLGHLNDYKFRKYIWEFAFEHHYELDERDAEGFHIFDVPQLSTEQTKVSLVLIKKGCYEEHMHLNSAAYFMIIFGRGKVILNGEKRRFGFDFVNPYVFQIPNGMFHGFEVTSETMLFISIQNPPILDEGVEDIHFHNHAVGV